MKEKDNQNTKFKLHHSWMPLKAETWRATDFRSEGSKDSNAGIEGMAINSGSGITQFFRRVAAWIKKKFTKNEKSGSKFSDCLPENDTFKVFPKDIDLFADLANPNTDDKTHFTIHGKEAVIVMPEEEATRIFKALSNTGFSKEEIKQGLLFHPGKTSSPQNVHVSPLGKTLKVGFSYSRPGIGQLSFHLEYSSDSPFYAQVNKTKTVIKMGECNTPSKEDFFKNWTPFEFDPQYDHDLLEVISLELI